MEKAVFDSSALIFCVKVMEIFRLINERFSTLLVPPVVFSEVVEQGRLKNAPEVKAIEELFEKGHLRKTSSETPVAPGYLERGEAEAIAVAKKLSLVCISDDRRAYSVGTSMGVKVVSLPALIISFAKKKKLSPQKAEELLSKLVSHGYYLKSTDYEKIREKLRAMEKTRASDED